MQQQVVYEQPLNERIRTFLRLEHLFRQLLYSLEGTDEWDSRASIATLLDLLSVFERTDLKNEIAKELERSAAYLTGLQDVPGVDRQRLDEVLERLDGQVDALHAMHGPVGHDLRRNEFLTDIAQRSGIPGGSCNFDLPGYHHWLNRPAEQRVTDLKAWFDGFAPVHEAVETALGLIRQSASTQQRTAAGGFYQQELATEPTCQLVRVGLPFGSPHFAEISGGKHRFSIRFMTASLDHRPTPTKGDVEFSLACCII